MAEQSADQSTEQVVEERADESVVASKDTPARRGLRRTIDRSQLFASMVIAVGLVGVGVGLAVSVTGDDANPLPTSLETVEPVPDAVQVLQQSNVFVDLVQGYTGRLVIDGIDIETVSLDEVGSLTAEPGQQIDIPPATVYEPGNATLTYTPSDGGPVETFVSGVHSATVVYWLVEDGPARSRTYSWTFTVV